jgi:hypothetical protein
MILHSFRHDGGAATFARVRRFLRSPTPIALFVKSDPR